MINGINQCKKDLFNLEYIIGEWLRDETEIKELLEQMGERVIPKKRESARQRLIELFEGVRPEHVISVIYDYSRQFAFMLDDIMILCKDFGISIAGEIQLPSGTQAFGSSPLDTTWAHIGRTHLTVDIEGRIGSLTAEINELNDEIRVKDLIRPSKKVYSECVQEVLNQFGLEKVDDINPSHQLAYSALQKLISLPGPSVIAKEDLRAVEEAYNVLDEMKSASASIPAIPGVSLAFSDLDQKLNSTLCEIKKVKMIEKGDCHSRTDIAEIISMLGKRVMELANDSSDVVRAEEGLHIFLRSEFWRARWRIFELWVLVRILRTIEHAGGTIHVR